ncbi:SCO2400 family protein [Streptomyces sp. MNU103]|uniref:SCO2400 family protein n=1 Tax=Streptomyces sp. MNU103 TaxID=2560024 RepID=UPI001E53953E|nr:hypothetical protein [Streptomyces sp. MNU103]
MDFCHPCRRHLNGALACPGCGTPVESLRDRQGQGVPTAPAGGDPGVPAPMEGGGYGDGDAHLREDVDHGAYPDNDAYADDDARDDRDEREDVEADAPTRGRRAARRRGREPGTRTGAAGRAAGTARRRPTAGAATAP